MSSLSERQARSSACGTSFIVVDKIGVTNDFNILGIVFLFVVFSPTAILCLNNLVKLPCASANGDKKTKIKTALATFFSIQWSGFEKVEC